MLNQIEKIKQPESREEIAQKTLNNILEKRNFREQLDIEELISEETFDLPDELKSRIARDFKIFKGHLDSPEAERKLVVVLANKDRQSFMESIGEGKGAIEVPNKSFSNYVLIQYIDEILKQDKVSLKDLKKVARVSFDLNGLKVINDIGGTYAQGDAYLKMAFLAINDPEIKKWAQENNIEYVASRDGGDEFGVVIKSNKNLTSEILNEFITRVQEKLRNQSTKDIIDFADEEVRLRAVGATDKRLDSETIDRLSDGKDEVMNTYNEKGLEETLKILKINNDSFNQAKEEIKKYYLKVADAEIPSDYSFKAEMPGAAATLYDGLMDEKNKINVNENQNYGRMMQIFMGTMLDTSERDMHENKSAFKINLARSKDAYERFLSVLYNRSEKAKEQEMKINRLEKIEAVRKRHEREEDEFLLNSNSIEDLKKLRAKHKEEIKLLEEI